MSDPNDLAQHLRTHVEFLAREPRPPRSAHHRAGVDYIAEHLTHAGFTVDASRRLAEARG